MDKEEIEKLVSDLMRLILFRHAHKLPLKKDDIRKYITKDIPPAQNKGLSNTLIKEAKKKFSSIFSYKLVEINKYDRDKQEFVGEGTGNYILINEFSSDFLVLSETQKAEQSLLMVILSLIHMSPQKVLPQEVLYEYLKRLGFDGASSPDIFENWQKLVETDFVKQLYLDRKKANQTTQTQFSFEGQVYEFRMGPRAFLEIGNENIEKFLETMFKDGTN